jgi:HlyD family secretion protein
MAKQNTSWIKWIIILIVVAGAIAGGVWYFRKDDGAVQYQTAAVASGDLQQVVTATGNLSPVVNVQVGSQISGRIQSINSDFNSVVKSNQVIAQIDPSTYKVAVMRAEAQVSNSIASLTLAQLQAERANSLFTNNLIPAADHDTAIAQLQQAEADVKTAQAALASASVDLSRCTIISPVDGVVISRNVDVGQTVAASFNTPTLFIIANDLSKMQIGALVSEADIGGVKVGQNVDFTVDAYPYRTFNGKVSQIRYGAITNQSVVNYCAMIEVDNSDLKLLPSMTANVSIIIQERENVLKVPNSALRFRPPETSSDSKTNAAPAMADNNRRGGGEGRGPGGGGQRGERGERGPGGGNRPAAGLGERQAPRTIYVLGGKDPNHPELVPVKIKTGITDGISTEVREGLKEGDQVVIGVITPDDSSDARGPSNPFRGGMRRF